MIRRRRVLREIAFSFDSFLDVVANVVGIILRLILLAWVGARSYTGLVEPAEVAPPAPPQLPQPAALSEPVSPLAPAVERARLDLADAKARLGRQQQLLGPLREQARQAERAAGALEGRRKEIQSQRAAVERGSAERARGRQAIALSLKELSERSKKLLAELDGVRSAPARPKELRYRTPVSQPVTEEVMFEVRHGRVTPIDRAALEEKVWQEVRSRQKELMQRWEMTGVTEAVGAFRLRWVAERERTLLDGRSAIPAAGVVFRARLVGYEVEPVREERGETAEAALKPGSAFRGLVDDLDPQRTAVTLWAYADSFPLYRRLRDYLHDRSVVVAGRPLPDGAPIGSSRHGTASRGQ
jgi:hypothetical protein